MRKGELIINLFPLILIGVVVPVTFVVLNPIPSSYVAFLFFIIGFSFFFIAKLSVIKTGKIISFGSGGMTLKYRKIYKIGYVLFFTGLIISIVSLLSPFSNH